MAYKEKTIVRAYAESKRQRLLANPLIREDIRSEIIEHINLTENHYLMNAITMDEAMEDIAKAESTLEIY